MQGNSEFLPICKVASPGVAEAVPKKVCEAWHVSIYYHDIIITLSYIYIYISSFIIIYYHSHSETYCWWTKFLHHLEILQNLYSSKYWKIPEISTDAGFFKHDSSMIIESSFPSYYHMGVSKNRDTPKSWILIGFSIIFTIHFGGPPLFLVQHPYYIWIISMLSRLNPRELSLCESICLPHGGTARVARSRTLRIPFRIWRATSLRDRSDSLENKAKRWLSNQGIMNDWGKLVV